MDGQSLAANQWREGRVKRDARTPEGRVLVVASSPPGRLAARVAGMLMVLGLGAAPLETGATEGGAWQTSPWRSIASLEWERHRLLPPWDGLPVAFIREAVIRPPVEVLGFLPYWNVGTAVVPLDRISTLAYFAVGVNGDGTLGSARDWGSRTLLPLVTAAREAGVRVVLGVTCFDTAQMASLLSSAVHRSQAINAIVNLVLEGGGEGVNVDFEGLAVAQKAAFVTFVRELKTAMDQALGRSSQVTVDTPAVDWSGAYDYDELALASDGLVIMGYDYHYRGGDPGPVAPIRPSDFWGKYSLEWTLDDYDHYGGKENRARFILALPLYGYDWPATSTSPGAKKTATATARFHADCQRRAAQAGGFLWDAPSETPWFFTTEGGIRQTWCENLRSLTAKVGLVADRGLGGLAFWALGYEGDLDDPWRAIEAAWPGVPDPPDSDGAGDHAPGHRDEQSAVEEVSEPFPEAPLGENRTDLPKVPDEVSPEGPAAEVTPSSDIASPTDSGTGEASGPLSEVPGEGDAIIGTGPDDAEEACRCAGCASSPMGAKGLFWLWVLGVLVTRRALVGRGCREG